MHQEKLATAAASAVPAHELQEVSRGSAPALEAPSNEAGPGAPAAVDLAYPETSRKSTGPIPVYRPVTVL